MFTVLAAAAEYELELRAERQADGQMLPGKQHIGRPRALGPTELATLRRLVDQDGVSVTEAARTLKIGRTTAYDALQLGRAEGSGTPATGSATATPPATG